MMEKKNEMKEMLLYCIHIAKHKGVFYTEPEFDKAKEYVENMLNEDEIDRIMKQKKLTMNIVNDGEEKNRAKAIVVKLEKQKELINDA